MILKGIGIPRCRSGLQTQRETDHIADVRPGGYNLA
jgi:hypothetical protein